MKRVAGAMTAVRLARLGAVLVLALGWAAGCAAPPKPAELEAFEKLRADPNMAQAKKRAPELMTRSDQLLEEARKRWQSGDLDESRNAALLGQIKLKQALSLAQQDRARSRIKVAEQQYATSEEELARVQKDLAAVNEQIALLDKLAQASAEKQKLAQQLNTDRTTLEAKATATDKISGAELALKEAETVNAAKYAQVTYQAATDLLTRAQKEFKDGAFNAAQTSAEMAASKAKDATTQARPQYQQDAQAEENKARAETLARDATTMSHYEVRRDAKGALQRLVITVPAADLFIKKQTTIAPGKDTNLQGIADLIQKYPSYPVQIVGYTDSRGKPGELLALSLARAQAVFSALVTRGVDAKRMIVSGQGNADPISDNRSSGGRAKNNRVEVLFLYQ